MIVQTIFIHLPSPLAPLQVTASPSTLISDLTLDLPFHPSSYYLRTRSSILTHHHLPLSTLTHATSPGHPVCLELVPRVRGGKGGFGTQLRAAGGRMAGGKGANRDSCRDLSGRRLSTLKEAERQAELLESLPELKIKAAAEEKAKLEALERTLGISSEGGNAEAGPGPASAASKRTAEDVDLEEIARKRHKFDDSKFLEESREINEGVRSAVLAGLLKKKKAKTDGTQGANTTQMGSVQKAKLAEKDKQAMPPPPVSKTAAVA